MAVIVHFSDPSRTYALALALAGEDAINAVIIVDHSVDDPERVQTSSANNEVVIRPPVNGGFGAGVNTAAACSAALQHDLLLVNPDIALCGGAVQELVSALGEDSALGAVSGYLLDERGRLWFSGGHISDGGVPFHGSPSLRCAGRQFLSGALLLIRREAFDEIGGFDTRYFLYWEDVAFTTLLTSVGWAVRVVSQPLGVHDRGTFDERVSRDASPHKVYFEIRNRYLYLAELFPLPRWRQWLGTIRLTVRVLRAGRSTPFRTSRWILLGILDGRALVTGAGRMSHLKQVLNN